MNRSDELKRDQDLDGDRIPDDDDTAEVIKDVADAFKTKNAGKPLDAGEEEPLDEPVRPRRDHED